MKHIHVVLALHVDHDDYSLLLNPQGGLTIQDLVQHSVDENLYTVCSVMQELPVSRGDIIDE